MKMRRRLAGSEVRAAPPLGGQMSLFAPSQQHPEERPERVVPRYCLRGHPELHGDPICRECALSVIDQCQVCGKKIEINLSQKVFFGYDLDKRREIANKERPLYCACKARFPWTWRLKCVRVVRFIVNLASAAAFLKLVEIACDWLQQVQK